jgi:hypothetical protein
MDRIYDPTLGKFRRTCTNPNCNQQFWGRKDQLYCDRRCKNQVNNARWRMENPKLNDKEKELRKNHRILLGLAEQNGYNNWFSKAALKEKDFNGSLYHSYAEDMITDKLPCKIITLFELKLYIIEGGKVLIKKTL